MYEYSGNIKIGDITLEVNPERYDKKFMKMGGFIRTVSGSLISHDVSGRKYTFIIKGLTQSQVDDIRKWSAAEHNISLVDFIPISEREQQSRSVYEDLGSETINGQTVYTYIPTYTVSIIDYIESFSGNVVDYTIRAEEM